MGHSVQRGGRCGRRASLGVILWQTGLFWAGPSSDAVCVLQRIPSPPPGAHLAATVLGAGGGGERG